MRCDASEKKTALAHSRIQPPPRRRRRQRQQRQRLRQRQRRLNAGSPRTLCVMLSPTSASVFPGRKSRRTSPKRLKCAGTGDNCGWGAGGVAEGGTGAPRRRFTGGSYGEGEGEEGGGGSPRAVGAEVGQSSSAG